MAQEKSSSRERDRQGERCALLGIVLNALLFAAKLTAGLLSSSVSVLADAFNNLSDGAASLLTLLGFRLSSRRPDARHPYGHGRMEYISGLLVSVMILLTGLELLRSAGERLLHPEAPAVTPLTLLILLLSMAVKLFLACFYRRRARQLRSESLRAAAADSRGDVLASAGVLFSLLAGPHSRLSLDALCGLVIGVLILVSGVRSLLSVSSAILGRQPDAELVAEIRRITESHPNILGVHDIMVHDYGPGRMIASLHAELPADGSFTELHDLVEHIQDELEQRLGCRTLIHMDPVSPEDESARSLRRMLRSVLCGIDPDISVHDFRLCRYQDVRTLSFDAAVPYSLPLSDEELKERIRRAMALVTDCALSIHIDRKEADQT